MRFIAIVLTFLYIFAFPGLAVAQGAKLGFLGDFSGPIQSLVTPILDGAKLAVRQVNTQGGLLGGELVTLKSGDTSCVDQNQAIEAAEQLVRQEKVEAIVGALCSGATLSAAEKVAIPQNIIMVSPSATSPAISNVIDNGLLFRTIASDAYLGGQLAKRIMEQGDTEVVLIHGDNDWNLTHLSAFSDRIEQLGGKVLSAHPMNSDGVISGNIDDALSYSSRAALVILLSSDQLMLNSMSAFKNAGFRDVYWINDGSRLGANNVEHLSSWGKIITLQYGARDKETVRIFEDAAQNANIDPTSVFADSSYDATFSLLLAMELRRSRPEMPMEDALRAVTTAPGHKVLPGEWRKATAMLRKGQEIDYRGVTGELEFNVQGDVEPATELVEFAHGKVNPINTKQNSKPVQSVRSKPEAREEPNETAVQPAVSHNISERRVALVVGNSDYDNAVELANPSNDAAEISKLLKNLGFETLTGINLTKSELDQMVRQFADLAINADTSLFFYAGHGIQVDGKNYLVPIDARLDSPTAVRFELVETNLIGEFMAGAGKVGIMLLDACRDNPLSRSLVRSMGATRSASVSTGLAPVTKSHGGMLIGFATAPGDVASDGVGNHSPFTSALLKHMATSGLEVQQMMTRVKAEVLSMTDRKQRPWHNSDLAREFFLAPISN